VEQADVDSEAGSPGEIEDPGWTYHRSDGAGFEGWLYHYADGSMVSEDGIAYEFPAPVEAEVESEQESAPDPESEAGPVPEAERDLETEPEVDSDDVPPFVEYSPTNLRRYVLGVVFVVSSAASVLAMFRAVQQGTPGPTLLAAALFVLATGSWWALLSWVPTVVSIRGGVLEVARGTHGDRFDLRDPDTDIEVGDAPASPMWKAVVRRADGSNLVIRANQVDAAQFAEIVAHHRARLRAPRATESAPDAEQE
jgi:hypothetical protein